MSRRSVETPVRIAMWSGPRNISTAMMRAWENREDCCVIDEPFYACYLHATGLDHPLRNEVLASQPRDWQTVIHALELPLPAGKTLQFQKHMSHHMVGALDERWLASVRHAFLIRSPAQMVASYLGKRGQVAIDDLGLRRQVELYEAAVQLTPRAPPVIDAHDVLCAPETMLRRLCAALEVPFSERMLSWPAGLRASDGVWASHWYDGVARSTGFEPPSRRVPDLTREQRAVVEACQPHYEFLRARKLSPD